MFVFDKCHIITHLLYMKGYKFMKRELKQSTDVLELKKLQTHFLVHSGPYTHCYYLDLCATSVATRLQKSL